MTLPPVPPSPIHQTAESILADTRRILQDSKSVQDAVVANVTRETATFANTIQPLAQSENLRLWDRQLIETYLDVSPDKSIREASQEARNLFREFDTTTALRDDLYALVRAVQDNGEAAHVNPESQRYVEKLLRSFERNGLALDEEDRKKLSLLNKRLRNIHDQYMESFRHSEVVLYFTRDELEGLSDELLDSLERGTGENAGTLRLPMTSDQYRTYRSDIVRRETQQRLWLEYPKKFSANVTLMEEMIVCRAKKAHLLGYANYEELQMADNMEKSPDKILAFLEDLLAKLTPEIEKRNQASRLRKQEALKARGEPDDGKFYHWEAWCYRKEKSKSEASASRSLREYFPLMPVVEKMLSVFDRLFGLDFVEVTKEELVTLAQKGHPAVWHDDVRLFAVWDDTNGERSRTMFIGYLYMDLYSRPGKREGFCDIPVRPAFTDADGTRRYTSTALCCSLPRPADSQPCLLEHQFVLLMFHELGHGIHDLVAHTQYALFHGASTPGDFNEAPSQMLEQWCWNASTLSLMSAHYSTLSPAYFDAWSKTAKESGADLSSKPPDKLPEDRVSTLVATRQEYDLGNTIGLLQRCLFNIKAHMVSVDDAEKLDTTSLHAETLQQITHFDRPNEDAPTQATQLDLFTVSSMHCYLVSRVYSLDMFQSAFKADPTNREQGLRYRRAVIGKGSSEDEMTFLTEFLGRTPNANALFEDLGLV